MLPICNIILLDAVLNWHDLYIIYLYTTHKLYYYNVAKYWYTELVTSKFIANPLADEPWSLPVSKMQFESHTNSDHKLSTDMKMPYIITPCTI